MAKIARDHTPIYISFHSMVDRVRKCVALVQPKFPTSQVAEIFPGSMIGLCKEKRLRKVSIIYPADTVKDPN